MDLIGDTTVTSTQQVRFGEEFQQRDKSAGRKLDKVEEVVEDESYLKDFSQPLGIGKFK